MKSIDIIKSFGFKIVDIVEGPRGNTYYLNDNEHVITFQDISGNVTNLKIDNKRFYDLESAKNFVRTPRQDLKIVPVEIEAYFSIKKIPYRKRLQNIEAKIYAKTPGGITFVLNNFRDDFTWRRKMIAPTPEGVSIDNQEKSDKFRRTYQEVVPDPKIVEPFVTWFKALSDHRYSSSDDSICWRKTNDGILRLLEAWPERPTGKYFGNNEFKALISVKNKPKYSVRVEPSGIDWLSIKIETEEELKDLTIDEIEDLLQAKNTKIVELPKTHIKYHRKDLVEIVKQAKELEKIGIDWNKEEQNVHSLQIPNLDLSSLDIKKELQNLANEFKGIPSLDIPDIGLRDYQKQGVEFIHWACSSFGGVLLADDMGLGKTVQVLTALRLLNLDKPSLIICPSSIVFNWVKEAKKFFPGLKVKAMQSGSGRKEQLAHADDYDLIVYNYHLARRDLNFLKEIKWGTIVIDEAQAIKNQQSDLSKSVKKLYADYRIALTGTPIENRLTDLQSIVDFVVPGYLGKSKDLGYIRGKIKPICIRRTKAEVAKDLPERIEERIFCEMNNAQREIYNLQLKRTRDLLETEPDVICILAELMKLRQICCDPDILGYESGSAKLDALIENLQIILETGNKVLVFSQFVMMLERIKKQLFDNGIKHYILTGQTENRQELVENFESDKEPSVFLISLKAGGVGLNLTSANHVILYDPWWNPAVEAQAIDRTHRIGQDKTVVALKMIMKDTIEEKIAELQDQKMELVKNVLGTEGFNQTLSKDDIRFILS